MLGITPWSLMLLLAPAPVDPAASSRQVRFGVEVAQKGLWREALFRFERAAVLHPNNAAALNNLAVAYEQAGELGKAREAYEKALRLKPKSSSILQNFDLFREADDKRQKRLRGRTDPKPSASPTPSPTPQGLEPPPAPALPPEPASDTGPGSN